MGSPCTDAYLEHISLEMSRCRKPRKDIKRSLNEKLLTAVWNEELEDVERALDDGASVNAMCGRVWDYQTALMIAVGTGREDMVELLIARGASVDLLNQRGVGAVHVAAHTGYLRVLTSLVERDPQSARSRVDPARYARLAETSDLDFCENRKCVFHYSLWELLSFVYRKGSTPLHYACMGQHTDCVEYLLNLDLHGEMMEERNDDNETAIMIAARNGWREGVELLLEMGADATTGREDGDSGIGRTTDLDGLLASFRDNS